MVAVGGSVSSFFFSFFFFFCAVYLELSLDCGSGLMKIVCSPAVEVLLGSVCV